MQGALQTAASLAPGVLVAVVAMTVVTVAIAAFRVMDQTDRFIGDRLEAAFRATAGDAAADETAA